MKADDPVVIEILRKHFLIPPSPLSYNLSNDPDYKKRAVSYGWSFAHDILEQIFKDEYSKFFVEAGGLDGEFLSNTLWLEMNKNWSGLIIEPERKNFLDMVNKRRKCWISESCLSTLTYTKKSTMFSVEKKPNATFLDSEVLRGGTHEINSVKDKSLYTELKKYAEKTEFRSQCFPLYSYLLALNVSVIDFLSLDIQGTEVDVFNTLPLDKVYVRTVIIEHEIRKFDTEFVKSMNKKGFNLLSVGGSPDYFFINANEKNLLKKYNGPNVQEFFEKGMQFRLVK